MRVASLAPPGIDIGIRAVSVTCGDGDGARLRTGNWLWWRGWEDLLRGCDKSVKVEAFRGGEVLRALEMKGGIGGSSGEEYEIRD